MNLRKLYLLMSLTLGVLALNGQDGDINRTSRTEIQLLDGENITVTISGAEYDRTGALSPQAFVPMNAPSALSITSVNAINLTTATVSLLATDFDADYNYFYIFIHDSVLNVGSYIETDTCALIANVERAVLTSSPLPLTEQNIGTDQSAYLDIDLFDEEFVSWNFLEATDFTLVHFPAGVNIADVDGSGTDRDEARLLITYSPGDFDSPIYNAAVTINDPAHLLYSANALDTDTLLIMGFTESVSFNSFLSSNLDENNLHNGVVVVELDNDQTTTTGSLNTGDLELINFPDGTSIQSASASGSRTRITINLNFDGTDFDTDDTDGRVRVRSSILTWNKTNDLFTTAGDIIITAALPSATVTPSSWPREFFLDTMSLYLMLVEEEFDPSETLTTGHFGFSGEPSGLSVGGLADQTDSTITLLLDYNGADFDVQFANVSVSINSSALLVTGSGFLYSEPFVIDANIEPVVSSVDIPNTSMKINDVVQATINLSEYITDSVYTLAGGNIGGYGLGSLQPVSGNVYSASFTISEGGNDYLASEPIPVNNLRLNDLPVTGINYNGNIVQGNDLLDAHKPAVSSLFVIGQEAKQIDDEVVLLISAFEEGLMPENTTEINLVSITKPNVRFEEIGEGTYSLIYKIEAGDQSVAEGALEAQIYLRDPAGNVNDTYPLIATNTLSIDASVPVILSTTNTTPTDTVIIGGEVILTVEADGSGYTLSSNTEVNGVKKNEGLIFSSAGTTYTIRYPVKDVDQTVAAGDLTARIILEDLAGNPSLPDTVILNNDIAVFTIRPTARLTHGDEICINDTATIYISLGGEPPWKLKYRNAVDSFYVDNIYDDNLSLKTVPTQTINYTIDSVWDGTGNENAGFGNALVIVYPLPVVDILNLDTIYANTDTNKVKLLGDPSGGTFFGPGVNSITGIFNPYLQEVTGAIPNWIYYEYTDPNFCFNVDSQAIEIVAADVTFIWPKDSITTACYFNDSYILEAFNTDGTIGSFSIFEADGPYPAEFITNNGNNTVTFNPSILDYESTGIGSGREFTIRYNYQSLSEQNLFEDALLRIEYFDTVKIVSDVNGLKVCTNESLIPITINTQEGWFTGAGFVDPDLGGSVYEFDPAKADTGVNWIIYTYESPNLCQQKDSALIVVNEAPVPVFEYIDSCVFSTGGEIHFRNISDTTGLGGTVTWKWNYGDIPSGEANEDVLSTMDNGSHYYPRPGERTVTLSAKVNETGCENFQSISKDLGNTPDVTIDWNTECFTNENTVFVGKSKTEDGNSVFRWRITDLLGTEILAMEVMETEELDSVSHQFETLDNYSVELTTTSARGCITSAFDTIYLRPYIRNISDTVPYIEDFEGVVSGWFAFRQEATPQMSWKLGTVESGEFPYDLPDNGSRAWYTDLTRNDTSEQSWVSSPCFDFSDMRRPMISLDRKVSSDRDRDGAALQYTYNDGVTWHNVGAIEDGSVNWYNTFRIQDGPGEQGEGWTGGFTFDPVEEWKQSRHELDELTGRPRVQFRIAFGSSGESLPQIENEGFAFDNIWIGERSRVVLIEHFTNSGMPESNAANERINKLVKNNPLDVIDVQYHAEVSGFSDRMNQDNPSPASARSLFYGTRQVPYMLMDGGVGGQMVYDFSDTDLDTLDLFSRALSDPSFEITLVVQEQDSKLDITLDLKALETLPSAEYIVYTAIIERLIDDPAYAGAGSVQIFENVVRDMVPNAAGISLIRTWEPGETENIPLNWNISDKVLDKEMLAVVVFVQDAESREIYQTASDDPDLNGDPVIHTSVSDLLKAKNISMLVYPNPARNVAYLRFAEAISGQMTIQVFNHTGSLVRNDMLPPGTEVYEMNLGGLENGVYLIRAIQNNNVIGAKKLLIIR